MHCLLGRAYEALGRYAEAHESYWKHIDLSHRLVTRELNDIVRRVCAEEGVGCVDGVRLLEAQAEHGLPGYDLFVDSMHPNEAGHALLAQGFLDAWLASEPGRALVD